MYVIKGHSFLLFVPFEPHFNHTYKTFFQISHLSVRQRDGWSSLMRVLLIKSMTQRKRKDRRSRSTKRVISCHLFRRREILVKNFLVKLMRNKMKHSYIWINFFCYFLLSQSYLHYMTIYQRGKQTVWLFIQPRVVWQVLNKKSHHQSVILVYKRRWFCFEECMKEV